MKKREIEKKNLTEEELALCRRRRIVSVVSLGIALLVAGAVAWFVGKPLIGFISQPEQFRRWVESHGFWGDAAMIGIRVLQTIITILPGEVVEIGAGYAFGAVNGWILCTLGTAIGTAVIYLLTKRFGIRMTEAFVPREKMASWGILKDSAKLYLMVFLIFLIPGTPKDTVTYLIGLTPIKLPQFLLMMSLARIPSILSSTIGGAALGTQNYTLAVWTFVAAAVMGIAGVIGYAIYSKRKKRVTE